MNKKIMTLIHGKYLFSIMLFLALSSGIVNAQGDISASDTTRKNAIRLFIDCQRCDMNYIKEQMPYINYVRDTREAQVYLLVTGQSTGSGGQEYTIFYSGQQEFAGMKDTLTYNANPDATQDITRTGLTNTMALGLMRYVARTSIKNDVKVSFQGARQEDPAQVADNWNYWVFSLETRPEFRLEKSQQQYQWFNLISVNRVTPEWKLQNNFIQSYEKNTFIQQEEDTITGIMTEEKTVGIRKSWTFNNLTVKSLTDHWSAGLRASVLSSSYNNLDLQVRVAPSVEYDIFPYSVSNQKQLRVLYGIGYVYNKYIDITIYDKTQEKLFEHTLDIALQVQQKWGSANMAFGYAAYLNDFSKNKVSLDANVRIRILKGLSLDLNGAVSFIHNQIQLAKGDPSSEDMFLRLAELETNYRYEGSVGLTYTFGSIYNNVVNPRFGGGGGFDGGQGGGGGGGDEYEGGPD
jgi:hypothetical protein